MTKLHLAALVAAMLLAACRREQPAPPAVPAAPAQPAASAEAAQAPSRMVPRLRVTTLDGGTFDLAERRGRWVVVNFWATWCKPCIKEMPELSALDAMREHIEVVGLAYEEIDPAAMREFLRKVPVVYPIAILDVTAPPEDFETPRGLPMTYLIAPDGQVAKTFLGPVTAKAIEDAIAAHGAARR